MGAMRDQTGNRAMAPTDKQTREFLFANFGKD
jgi:hypothetical protein